MNKEFENALDTAVRKTGLTHQKAFDGLIKIALLDVIEHGLMKENAQFKIGHVETRFFEHNLSADRYQALDVVRLPLLSVMSASAPFEDVIGNYYENRFIKKKPSDQEFMTAERVSEFVEKMKADNDDEPKHEIFADLVSRTGKHSMSFLQQIFNICGKEKLLNRKLIFSDTHASQLRIAIYQIMVNCIRHDVRIGETQAINFDMMKTVNGCENHRVWWVAAKTGDERTIALNASAEQHARKLQNSKAA